MALLLEPLLVAAGHEVAAVIRNPEHAVDVAATGATAVVADVESLDTAGLTELLHGTDAVVWSAGAGGGNPARTVAVDRDAAIRSMDAASAAGVRRYVMVSYLRSGRDDVAPDDSFYPYAQAKAEADAYLRGTDLDWTVLGPGRLTDAEPTGRIAAGAEIAHGDVSRGNVARVVAAVLTGADLTRQDVGFVDGEEPIEQALHRDGE